MSVEIGKLSEISDLQRDLNKIAVVEDLEARGVHAHSLLRADKKMPDAPLLEAIDRTIHQETKTPQEQTFAQRNKALIRRRTRNIGARLLHRR